MSVALTAGMRSTCIKRHVGAVLTKNKRTIAGGYNGAPRGLAHCTKETCTRLNLHSLEESKDCRGVHAESNRIIQSALYGASCYGAVIYVTRFPCTSCTKQLINAEIVEIVYLEESDMNNEIKMAMLHEAGIRIRQIKITPYLEKVIQLLDSVRKEEK